MNIPINNPAGRLYNMLQEIKKNYTLEPYIVFAEVFDLDPSDTSSALEAYAALYTIIQDIKDCILKLPHINHDRYLSPINDVILALSQISFKDPNGLRSFNECLNDKIMIRLEYCAEALSSAFSANIIEDDALNKLSKEIESLINSIEDFEINNNLKILLLNNLENIRIAITRYHFYGTDGIRSMLESCLGSVLLNSNLANTEDEKSVLKKTFEFIYRINQVFNFNKNIKDSIIPMATHLLDSLKKGN